MLKRHIYGVFKKKGRKITRPCDSVKRVASWLLNVATINCRRIPDIPEKFLRKIERLVCSLQGSISKIFILINSLQSTKNSRFHLQRYQSANLHNRCANNRLFCNLTCLCDNRTSARENEKSRAKTILLTCSE